MTARGLAGRYGRALLDVAVRSGGPDRVERVLAGLAALLSEQPGIVKLLAHPGLALSQKQAILDVLVARVEGGDPLVRRLVGLLVERGRLALLPEILRVYRARLMENRRLVEVRVRTAAPLAPALVERLRTRLSEMTGRGVQLVVELDPALLGGVVARIGSVVYDGSLRRQLERVKERLQQAV